MDLVGTLFFFREGEFLTCSTAGYRSLSSLYTGMFQFCQYFFYRSKVFLQPFRPFYHVSPSGQLRRTHSPCPQHVRWAWVRKPKRNPGARSFDKRKNHPAKG